MKSREIIIYIALIGNVLAGVAAGQDTVTITFDEFEILGLTDITDFMGTNWTGGIVGTRAVLEFYSTGTRAYDIDITNPDGAEVTLNEPADSVEFFYVHGLEFPAGTARAFSAEGVELGSADSADAFSPGNKVVMFDFTEPISRITFSSGIVDTFTYVTEAPPADGMGEGTGDGLGEGMPEGVGEGMGEGMGDGAGEGMADGAGEGMGDGSGEGMAEGATDTPTDKQPPGCAAPDGRGGTSGPYGHASDITLMALIIFILAVPSYYRKGSAR